MQNLSVRPTENGPREIRVEANECRVAQPGERLVARAVFADVVVTVQVPSVGFAAMLRFSAPQQTGDQSPRLEALCHFASQALALVFESIHSMAVDSAAIRVSVIGAAETEGQETRLASAVEQALARHGVVLNGSDLGGTQTRSIWLDSASGRLIVRSAGSAALPSQPGQWLPPARIDAIA